MARPMLALEFLSFYSVFALCFWVGLIFALISGLMSGVFHGIHAGDAHIGGDVGHGDAGGHADHGGHAGDVGGGHAMPDFPAFSPVTISAFVTVFGGAGMIFTRIEATREPYFAVPLALASAFGGAYVLYLIFSKLFSATQSSSEVVQQSLIGQSATVITAIPAQGMGEIAYVGGGGRQNAQARSADGTVIVAGSEVFITKIVGGSFSVSRTKPSEQQH